MLKVNKYIIECIQHYSVKYLVEADSLEEAQEIYNHQAERLKEWDKECFFEDIIQIYDVTIE
jgi:hypothetical protein